MSNTYVVTACNRGLGLEFARQLEARGNRVIATCRNPNDAPELGQLGVDVHQLDVSDAAGVERFAAALAGEPIDVLINNAGVGVRSRPLESVDFDEMMHFFAVNSVAPLRLATALLPQLRAGDGKTIINLTSRMGSIADNSSGAAYAYRASKAALNIETRSLAVDLRAEGFVCVVLHPGWVETDMGGANAPVPVADSIKGMLDVIDGLEAGDSGEFFDFSGERVPW